MKRLALVLVLAVGCVPATGTMVEVQGPDPATGQTSLTAGVATLEFVVAHASYCDRWVQDASASRTRVSVAGRDLEKRPFDFLVAPSHQTDLTQPVYIAALAYSATGQLLGEATFGRHPFGKDQVFKRQSRLQIFGAAERATTGPKYVTDDGCVCIPGQPWLGTATGTGCDPRVITSFDRLADTAGCELTPKGAPLPDPVCDGQQYRDEPTNRQLPCWAGDGTGACRMTTRRCADHDGQAWGEECVTNGGDFALPAGSALCSRYLACEQTACGDVVGCFETAMGTPLNVACTLRVDPGTQPGDPIQACDGTMTWKAAFPQATGTSCVAAVVQGSAQPPFTLGLAVAGQTAAQATATDCPLTLQVDAIDAPYPMAVPKSKIVDVVVGEHLVRVTIDVVLECPTAQPSLSCRAM